jgi:hypothetical protein
MGFDQNKSAQTVWAVLLMAMGLLLFIKTPYAVQQSAQPLLLNIARYIIAAMLTVAGARKFYLLYFSRPQDRSQGQ